MSIRMGDLRKCNECLNSVQDALEGICCNSTDLSHQNMFLQYGPSCAANCNGYKSILDTKNGHIKNEDALKFMLAGKCEFVVISGKTGVKLAYKLTRKKTEKEGQGEFIYYLNTMLEGDMIYAGVLFFDENSNSFKFAKGTKGQVMANHLNIKSLLYILNNLQIGNSNLNLRIYHIGRCGRCGKKLTTPESILTGLGPECSKLSGIPRVKVAKKDFK